MPLVHSRRILAHTSANGDPITVGSVVVNEGECVLNLSLKIVGATDRSGGAPTLNGFTATQRSTAQKAAATPEVGVEMWDWVSAVPAGTYTLTIPNTGALTIFYELDAADGQGGRAEFDAANGANATATNPSPGAVTRAQPGIAYAIVGTGAQSWGPSAQVGTALHNTDDGAHGTGRQYLEGGVGSLTLSWTFGTSEDYGAIVAAYRWIPPVQMPAYHPDKMRTPVAAMKGSG